MCIPRAGAGPEETSAELLCETQGGPLLFPTAAQTRIKVREIDILTPKMCFEQGTVQRKE